MSDAVQLSPLQIESIQLLADGNSAKQIAYRMGLTEFTVQWNIRMAKERLGVKKETALVARAFREQWIA